MGVQGTEYNFKSRVAPLQGNYEITVLVLSINSQVLVYQEQCNLNIPLISNFIENCIAKTDSDFMSKLLKLGIKACIKHSVKPNFRI